MEQGMEMKSAIPVRPPFDILDQFKSEVDRYEHQLDALRQALTPVIMESSEVEGPRPEEAPYNDYHAVVLRLANLNDHLQSMTHSIKL